MLIGKKVAISKVNTYITSWESVFVTCFSAANIPNVRKMNKVHLAF